MHKSSQMIRWMGVLGVVLSSLLAGCQSSLDRMSLHHGRVMRYLDRDRTAFETQSRRRLQQEGVQVDQLGERHILTVSSDKLFLLGQGRLKPSAEPLLLDLIRYIRRLPASRITIAAHTDNVASPAKNLKLSRWQARSVESYFWANGINKARIRILAQGEHAPIANNNNPHGSALNRRIVITL